MAFVRVEQRNAHLAGAVRLNSVEGRDGPISKATLTAISNTRRGGRGEGDNRGEEATAIQWTLWGKQAENAAQYLGKGSHINVVGRVQNNNYDRDGDGLRDGVHGRRNRLPRHQGRRRSAAGQAGPRT